MVRFSPPSCLFVYGTLMADEVLLALLGHAPARRAATVRGLSRGCVIGESYPAVMRTGDDSCTVKGLLLEGLQPRHLRALDYYEDEGKPLG